MTSKKVMLYFPISETEKPIVYHLVRDFDLMVNIYRAKVTPEEEGYLVLDLSGTEENFAKAKEFLKEFNVKIQDAGKSLVWNAERCTSCGECLTHCPTGALHIPDRNSMKVDFNIDDCIECLSCIQNCPFRVCSSLFANI
ncbi:MAG: 4Fe-4S dicluster domain-containing protein [Spirochaetales bacterium]|nr:4Fe-4S dicluster domain-containing protein [Spirochaetales bacterium]